MNRGDLYWVDLTPARGSEQTKVRPAVVVQSDRINATSPVTIVAPATRRSEAQYRSEVFLSADAEPVEEDSVVQTNQIRVVSVEHRLEDRMGAVSTRTMRGVERALQFTLGLL